MSDRVFAYDKIELDASKIEDATHPIFGPTTVFRDVILAREIVHEYGDGMAYKPADELEAAYWTAEGMWAISGGHPDTAIIMNRDQMQGKTVNVRFSKSLKDPKTNRPNNRGIIGDLEVYNSKVPSETLDAMKSGKKHDVSIGFFFSQDMTPGTIEEDGHPLKGTAFDYVQRKIAINHTAFGLDAGRCPMPFCGIGADEITRQITGDPFGRWQSMTECIKDIMKENPDYTEEQAAATCATIEKRSKAKKDAVIEMLQKWRDSIDEVLSNLDKEQLKANETQIVSDMSLQEVKEHFRLSDKSWDNLLDTEQLYLISLFKGKTPDVIMDEECEDCKDDYDEFIAPHIAKDARLTYAQKKALPDEVYAYIEPGCEKEDGKTAQRCRHMPLNDEEHVRAALQALGGARTGKVPSYASKAKPKVCAAAKKFKIESEVCGTKKDVLDLDKVDEILRETAVKHEEKIEFVDHVIPLGVPR